MKSRASWIFVTVAVIALVTILAVRRRPAASPPARAEVSPTKKNPSAATARTIVPIEDGKTIDFSPGFPIIKDSEKEKAIITRVAKEMEDAARGVTFESPKAAGQK